MHFDTSKHCTTRWPVGCAVSRSTGGHLNGIKPDVREMMSTRVASADRQFACSFLPVRAARSVRARI